MTWVVWVQSPSGRSWMRLPLDYASVENALYAERYDIPRGPDWQASVVCRKGDDPNDAYEAQQPTRAFR